MIIRSPKHFCDLITVLRKKRGLTRMDLSDRAGVAYNTITNIEHGRANPTIGLAIKIVNALDLTLDIFDWGDELVFVEEERLLLKDAELLDKWRRKSSMYDPNKESRSLAGGTGSPGYVHTLREFLKEERLNQLEEGHDENTSDLSDDTDSEIAKLIEDPDITLNRPKTGYWI